MSRIEEFKVLKLNNIEKNSSQCHVLFIKEHSIKNSEKDKPEGRTLFVLNVPPYISSSQLNSIFSCAGNIVHVSIGHQFKEEIREKEIANFGPKPKFKFNFAHIVFQKSEDLKRVLNLDELVLNMTECVSGVEKWQREYVKKFPKTYLLKNEIDEYMKEYDIKEVEAKALANKIKADADGWVFVPKRGTNAGFEQKESVVNNLEDKIEKGKKKKELLNFYTFQIRESKMKHIVSLREKFEQDKKRIAVMKKTRRFNPF